MNQALSRCHSIAALRRLARRRLPRSVFDYLDGAAGDEVTARRNRTDFERYELLPRVLTDVSEVDLTTTALGASLEAPLILAPTGMSRLFHHEGEPAAARAAADAGVMYSLSSMATTSIERVAACGAGAKMFQLYVWKDRGLLREFIDRARAAGYQALCLTADLPVAGHRERDLLHGFTAPPRLSPAGVLDMLRRPAWLWGALTTPRLALENVREHAGAAPRLFSVMEYAAQQFDPSLSWKDADWMLQEWNGPFAVKGILSAADARRAAAAGATALIVSNHGGRQLDHAPSPLAVLPEIADAVGDRMELILDGGIRRGGDVIKALALGAAAVMIGRAYLYGLGAGGEAGVARALFLLKEELRRDLTLLGCASVKDLGSDHVRRW